MPPVLLVGDLAYEPSLIFKDQVPGTGDAKTLHESYAKIRALAEDLPELVIVASHDPKAAKLLEDAMNNRSAR